MYSAHICGIKSILNCVSILLIYFAAAVGLNDNLNPIALYIAIPISFLCSCYVAGIAFWRNKYIRWLVIMYLWVTFTAISSINIDRSLRQLNAIIGCVLVIATISNLATKKQNLPWLYLIYLIILVSFWIYIKENVLTLAYDFRNARLGDSKLNTNKIAYFTCFVTFALYILDTFNIKRWLKSILRVLFLLMIPITFITAIYTASRQIFIIQVPLISFLIYVRYIKSTKKKVRNIGVGFILILICGCLFAEKIETTYDASFLKKRSERNYANDERAYLIKDAIEVGFENPIVGVGPGCFAEVNSKHLFSHCTYTELFANSGIPAVIFFIVPVFGFILNVCNTYRHTRGTLFLAFIIIGSIYAFYNIFYVFYVDLWLMSFFALITSHYILLKREYGINSPKRVSRGVALKF